ncbi:hypothetical protein KJ966_06905 [bacterium]|nr:hypothetical protein [bacterium]
MSIFDKPLVDLSNLLKTELVEEVVDRCLYSPTDIWPKGGGANFVLKQDTAVELGSPKTRSASFMVWTDKPGKVNDGTISVFGPSLRESKGMSIPFGQVILLELENSDQKSDYQLFRELEEVKYQTDLKGYMKRGASQFLREWSRISNDAMDKGFSFRTLGNVLIRQYRNLEYVKAIEIVFITSPELLDRFLPIAARVLRIIEAMNKMLNEALVDCDTCDYSDICRDVEELRIMRKQKMKEDSA